MAQKYDLVAELREDQGKGASRRLRREGKVPAIIYGAGRPPRNLAFDHNKVDQGTRERSVLFEHPKHQGWRQEPGRGGQGRAASSRRSGKSCTWISSVSSKTRRSA